MRRSIYGLIPLVILTTSQVLAFGKTREGDLITHVQKTDPKDDKLYCTKRKIRDGETLDRKTKVFLGECPEKKVYIVRRGKCFIYGTGEEVEWSICDF